LSVQWIAPARSMSNLALDQSGIAETGTFAWRLPIHNHDVVAAPMQVKGDRVATMPTPSTNAGDGIPT